MIYTSIDNIQYGTVLAKNIYNERGEILLRKGAALTVGLLTRLRNVGVSALYVEDERFNNINTEDMVSDQTKNEVMQTVAGAMDKIQNGRDFDIQSVSKVSLNLISEISANKDVLVVLNDIRSKDNALFVHSMNVTILSVLMGLKSGLNQLQLKDLAMGTMLHDIGKAKTDKMEEHPKAGFDILRKKHDFSVVTAHIALQHHEHVDGTGYPRGTKDTDIPQIAKIVAICDYFDTRLEMGDAAPYEICEEIMGYAGIRFDLNLVRLFLQSVALYPTGSWVALTTGDTGVVFSQKNGLPSRPKIRLLRTKDLEADDYEVLSSDTETIDIDLTMNHTVFVRETMM